MKAIFSSETSLKIFSLILGVVIFLAVRTESQVTTTVALRLAVREPAGLINTSEIPPEVTVRVTGSARAIRALAPAQLGPVTLDLHSFEKGVSTVRIREDQLTVPPGLEVVSISPSALSVRLEVKEKRKLPVQAILQGSVAPGYMVERTTVEPGEVVVEGPRREMREARFVRTAPVDVSGATEPVTASVVYELPGPHVRVAGGHARAEVRVGVGVERAERVVSLQVADVPGLARAVPVRARLRGPRTLLEALDEKALSATAVDEGKGLEPFVVRIENLPEGIEVLEPLPTVPRPAPPPYRKR